MPKKKASAPQSIQIRQGDVFLFRVDGVPDGAKLADERTERGLILQHGEVTDHAHRIPHRAASMYRTEVDARYMKVTAPVALMHEEHKTRCALCQPSKFVIATHYDGLASGIEAKRYMCEQHITDKATKLKEPGATIVPPGVYQIVIHAEYQPGELPRQVAD